MLPGVLKLCGGAVPREADLLGPPRGPARDQQTREIALQRLREMDELGLSRDRVRYAAFMGELSRR